MVNQDTKRWKAIAKYSIESNEYIQTYPSIVEAARNNGLRRQVLSNCLNRGSGVTGGYRWVFVKDYKQDNTKRCCKCEEILTEKNIKKTSFFICNKCYKLWKSKRLHNVNEFIARSYRNHRRRSKERDEIIPYNLEDLLRWVNKKDKFFEMHKVWVSEGKDASLTPSIVLKDKKKPYTLDNLEIITSAQIPKSRENKMPLEQWNREGTKLLCRYSSPVEAHNKTGISRVRIMAVARKRVYTTKAGYKARCLTAGGYLWKFSNIILKKFEN